MKTISSDEFYQKTKQSNLTIIDVREKNEFVNGHIPNSTNLPLTTLAFNTKSLSKDTEYYLVCASGSRSNMAASALSKLGYNVTNVIGGVSTWKGALIR